MFEQSGESLDGKAGVGQCPGETDCSYFHQAAGNTPEEKASEACTNCPKLPTKPRSSTYKIEETETEELVDEIENIVFYENGGSKTDWSCYPFEYLTLASIWRECERQIENRQRQRMKLFIESFGVRDEQSNQRRYQRFESKAYSKPRNRVSML